MRYKPKIGEELALSAAVIAAKTRHLTEVTRSAIALGIVVVVLLALTDQGRPGYDPAMSASVAALGIPVFACTPDLFPDMMAAALRREDVGAWAAGADIKLVRAEDDNPAADA